MTEPPVLREPDLPRTAKIRPTALRTGFTTGSCAAAAAKAAALALASGVGPGEVEITLPAGTRVRFAVQRCTVSTAPDGTTATTAEAVVVKDAGDDPDVTHGAHLTATVSWAGEPGVTLHGGAGVGTVTRAGLGLAVGAPAINPVPRRMITASVAEAVDLALRGVVVTISVPGGEQMAKRTTNARLGILGGISILGTSGIVRPFSTASWRASVEQAVSVLSAQGGDTVVLATGGRTEKVAMRLLPALPEVAFIEVGDFTGAAVRRAVTAGLAHVVFVGMPGKLTKLAAGVLMTHYTRSRIDTGMLAEITAAAGGDAGLCSAVREVRTARHAYELWAAAGLVPLAGQELCRRVADVLHRFSGQALTARVALVDPDGRVVVARDPGWHT